MHPSRRPKYRIGRSLLVAAALVSVGVVGFLGKKSYQPFVSKPQVSFSFLIVQTY